MDGRRILIVEDEVWERRGIASLLRGQSGKAFQIFEAANGEEALEHLSRHSVDIVLTDIKMPFMDGLELIRWCGVHQKRAKIAVISGYSDFEYVKEALTIGAADYLLKPVRQGDLAKCLAKLEELLDQEDRERQRRQKQLRDQEMLQSYMRDIEMSNYITARDRYSPEAVALERIPLPCRMLLLRCGRGRGTETTVEGMIRRRFEIRRQLEKIFPDGAVFENCYKAEEYLIFAAREEEECRRRLEASELWREAETADLCVGQLLRAYGSIPGEYRNMITKIIRNRKIGSGKNVFDSRYEDVTSYRNLERYQSQEMGLKKAFSRKNVGQIRKLLFEGVNFQDIENWYLFEAVQVLAAIRNMAVSEAKEQDALELQNLFDTAEAELSRQDPKGDTVEALLSQVLDRFEEGEEAEHTITDNIIGRIKEYVNENYGESITLQDVADKFYLNASYLSRSFKKAEGKNLITYLTEVRMEHAKEYLREGESKLAEVAFLVGYDDYSYFNKVFKRYTGLSPSEYMKRPR